MSDIEKVWNVAEWRAEFRHNKDKEQKKLYDGMQGLVREILAASLVKHHSMDEAIMAVYLTGIYHALQLGKD